MADPRYRDDYPARRRAAATYKAGSFTTTGTTAASIWTPATGLFVRVFRIRLQAFCSTVLAGATVGDPIFVFDSVITAPIGSFSAQNIGSATATRAAQLGSVVAANDAVTVHYGYCDIDFGTSGLRLGAANNVLKAGVANTITTGVITFQGFVLGIEEPAGA